MIVLCTGADCSLHCTVYVRCSG